MGHLDSLIEYLQAGNEEDARMRAHQALFDLQRLRANVPDRSKGRSEYMVSLRQSSWEWISARSKISTKASMPQSR